MAKWTAADMADQTGILSDERIEERAVPIEGKAGTCPEMGTKPMEAVDLFWIAIHPEALMRTEEDARHLPVVPRHTRRVRSGGARRPLLGRRR